MDPQTVISCLLTVIGFLLVGIYSEQRRMARNVEQLLINQAAIREQLEDHERRISNLEHLNKSPNGKG